MGSLAVPPEIMAQRKQLAALKAQVAEYTAMFASKYVPEDGSDFRQAMRNARKAAWYLMEEVGIIDDAEAFIAQEEKERAAASSPSIISG